MFKQDSFIVSRIARYEISFNERREEGGEEKNHRSKNSVSSRNPNKTRESSFANINLFRNNIMRVCACVGWRKQRAF